MLGSEDVEITEKCLKTYRQHQWGGEVEHWTNLGSSDAKLMSALANEFTRATDQILQTDLLP